jgi:hypothetical protein
VCVRDHGPGAAEGPGGAVCARGAQESLDSLPLTYVGARARPGGVDTGAAARLAPSKVRGEARMIEVGVGSLGSGSGSALEGVRWPWRLSTTWTGARVYISGEMCEKE